MNESTASQTGSPSPTLRTVQLPENSDALQALLEAIPIPMLVVRRADGRILFVNRHVEKYFDAPAPTIVGRPTSDFYLNQDDRQRLAALLDAQGFVHDFEVQTKGPNGKLYWLSVSIQPLLHQGEPCAFAGLIDVTPRKDAEISFQNERRLLTRLLELHERDRQLIGFDIHDGIVQDMTATVMFLEAASNDVEELGIAVPESLTRALDLVRDGINEARRLINGLQPPVLDEAGLIAAIEILIKDLKAKSGIDVEFHHPPQFPRLASPMEMAIYRIVQEALNNVWKHSEADSAEVRLTHSAEQVEIQIHDTGRGFDPTQVHKKRYGLVGIRERARLLNGQALIESTPGQGTHIRVELPITDLPATGN